MTMHIQKVIRVWWVRTSWTHGLHTFEMQSIWTKQAHSDHKMCTFETWSGYTWAGMSYWKPAITFQMYSIMETTLGDLQKEGQWLTTTQSPLIPHQVWSQILLMGVNGGTSILGVVQMGHWLIVKGIDAFKDWVVVNTSGDRHVDRGTSC